MTDELTVRPKRGRPIATKTLITQKIRERIAQRVAEKVDPILDALIHAAIGNITLEKTDSKERFITPTYRPYECRTALA